MDERDKRNEKIRDLHGQGYSTLKIAKLLDMNNGRVWQILNPESERQRLAVYRKTQAGRKAHAKIALKSFHKKRAGDPATNTP